MTIVITSLFSVSFFNIVDLRVPIRELIVSPHSYCTTCDQKNCFLTSFRSFLF
ncbi:prepilin peptidase [Sporosarcina sp. FSL K6-1540]|uniref:prepilin peptidase n=1 Tax=Sporosarcina sp. FSL K6-1540 TaxID=2921555 RepID=UPI003159D956